MTFKTLARGWMSFWFAPRPADDLGLCRLFFFGGLCAFYLTVDFAAWGKLPRVFWMPIWTFQVARIPMPPAEVIEPIEIIWKGALILSAIGLLTRPATWLAFLLGFYLLGLPHNFGKMHHTDALLVIVLGFLSLSRCGDSWSLDRLILRRRSTTGPPRIDTSGEYTWPIRAVQVSLSLVFFAAGFSKLNRSGLEWAFSDNLARAIIKQNYYVSDVMPITELGLDLAASFWMSRGLAVATLILEVGYPLALFGKIPRIVFVTGMFFAQVGFRILMGPTFFAFMLCNVFWVPWGLLIPARDQPRKSSLREQGSDDKPGASAP